MMIFGACGINAHVAAALLLRITGGLLYHDNTAGGMQSFDDLRSWLLHFLSCISQKIGGRCIRGDLMVRKR